MQRGINEDHDYDAQDQARKIQERPEPPPSGSPGIVKNRFRHAYEFKDILAGGLSRINREVHTFLDAEIGARGRRLRIPRNKVYSLSARTGPQKSAMVHHRHGGRPAAAARLSDSFSGGGDGFVRLRRHRQKLAAAWDLRAERSRRSFAHVYSSSRVSWRARRNLCDFWHGALPYRIDGAALCRSGDLLFLRRHCSQTTWTEICEMGILAGGAVPVSCQLLGRGTNGNPRSVFHGGSIGFCAGS